MSSLGVLNDVSDDEDMVIVSLLDFNDGEEEEENDEDDDDDDTGNIKKVKKCGDDDEEADKTVALSNHKNINNNNDINGGGEVSYEIKNVCDNKNCSDIEKEDKGLDNDDNDDDKPINTNYGDDENGRYDNDDDDDMVPCLSYSYSPSIPTIDEEDGEDDDDNDNNKNNKATKVNEGRVDDGSSINLIDNKLNNKINNNSNNKINNNNKYEDERKNGKEKTLNQKCVTITSSIHHPLSSSNACLHGSRGTSPRDAWKRAFRMIKCMKDPWEKHHILDRPHEFATRHRFHALRKQWVTDRVEVKMEDKAFDQGAMRSCFRIKKLPTHAGKHRDWKHAHNYVAKQYLAQHVTRDVYFSDVMLQMNAKLWGEEYSRHHPPKKVDIVQMCVLEFTDRPPDQARLYHLEHYIEGDYTKYNSNSGFVEESLRLTPQAFSHFTFERSGHQLIVVDIQGVGDLWTDPQIHSTEDIFGEGNLACKGMALFFHSHQCNPICTSLGLSPFDLASNEVKVIKESKANQKAVCTDTIVRERSADSIPCSAMHPSDLLNFIEKVRSPSCSESDDDGIVDDVSPPVGCYGGNGGFNHHRDHHNHSFNNPYHHFNHSHYTRSHHSHKDHEVETTLLHRPTHKARQRFYSESEDSVSLNKAEEEYRQQFETEHQGKHKPACVQFELRQRNLQAVRKLSDSVLGQVHHELAKYHEMGRFSEGREEGDLVAALFHERCAAELGVKEAMVTMASIYFDLPRELLINASIEKSTETTLKGEEYLLMAAAAGDRGAMIYLARAYETGEGLSTDCKSVTKAVEWYEGVLEMQCEDEVGEFDPLVDNPPYNILATLARLYSEGEGDLERDYAYAGELYSRAGEEATRALKGRLASKYYVLAEEMNALVSE